MSSSINSGCSCICRESEREKESGVCVCVCLLLVNHQTSGLFQSVFRRSTFYFLRKKAMQLYSHLQQSCHLREPLIFYYFLFFVTEFDAGRRYLLLPENKENETTDDYSEHA